MSKKYTRKMPICCGAPGMDEQDFRGIRRAAQEALRQRVLFLIERQGLTHAEAAVGGA